MKTLKLPTKLLCWLLIVALIPLGLFGYAGYLYTVKTLKKESMNSLVNIARSKALIIDEYFRDKEQVIFSLSHNPIIIDTIKQHNINFNEDKEYQLKHASIDKSLRQYLKHFTHYKKTLYDVFLINNKGDILFTMVKEEDYGTNLMTGPFKDTQLAKTFRKTLTLSATGLSPFEYYPPSNDMGAFIGAPIWDDGMLLGAICTQIDTKKIFELAADYKGLRETGETVLGALQGNIVEITAPLRHDPGSAFKKTIPIGSQEAMLIQLASQAFEGAGSSVDYRGIDIFAVWSYLHYPGWGMVVKIDTDEVFAPAQKYKQWMIYIGIITVLCVLLISIYVSGSISDPVVKLTDAVNKISEGDLFTRIDVNSGDEIGQLAKSFNHMMGHLQRSQEALQKRTDELAKSNLELDDFAYIASHDLKEPLRGIYNFASFLIEDYEDKLDDDGKNKLFTLKKLSQRLERLINDLLYYSRVERIHEAFQDINLDEVLDEALDTLNIRIEDHGIDVRRKDILPTVFCDKSRILDVFINLITNAMKYNDKDEKWIEIGVDKDKSRHVDVIYFKDNGIGIREKYLESIFKIFKRIHGRDKYGGGTGAGLTIVKKIVEYHGGTIWAESSFGHGTTFRFTLKGEGDENQAI